MTLRISGVPTGWHIVFDFIDGSVRIVNPLTGEWRPYYRPA